MTTVMLVTMTTTTTVLYYCGLRSDLTASSDRTAEYHYNVRDRLHYVFALRVLIILCITVFTYDGVQTLACGWRQSCTHEETRYTKRRRLRRTEQNRQRVRGVHAYTRVHVHDNLRSRSSSSSALALRSVVGVLPYSRIGYSFFSIFSTIIVIFQKVSKLPRCERVSTAQPCGVVLSTGYRIKLMYLGRGAGEAKFSKNKNIAPKNYKKINSFSVVI